MELKKIIKLFQVAVDEGTETTLKEIEKTNVFTKAVAYRIYGRSNVDRWLTERLLILDGKFINKENIESIASKNNRITYLSVEERK